MRLLCTLGHGTRAWVSRGMGAGAWLGKHTSWVGLREGHGHGPGGEGSREGFEERVKAMRLAVVASGYQGPSPRAPTLLFGPPRSKRAWHGAPCRRCGTGSECPQLLSPGVSPGAPSCGVVYCWACTAPGMSYLAPALTCSWAHVFARRPGRLAVARCPAHATPFSTSHPTPRAAACHAPSLQDLALSRSVLSTLPAPSLISLHSLTLRRVVLLGAWLEALAGLPSLRSLVRGVLPDAAGPR